MKRVFGLIQARMGSQRLPGKVMLPLAGMPMVGHIVERLRRVAGLSGVVLATTTDSRNDMLAAYAATLDVPVWREPAEDDIAARLCHAAQSVDAEGILKVNADSPLVDPHVLQQMLAAFNREGADYVSNKIVWSYPKGLSAEVIASRTLLWCHENLAHPHDREYVADWIKSQGDRFRIISIESGRQLGHHEWMVDTQEDYTMMVDLFETLYRSGECFGMEDVLAHLGEVDA